MSDDTGPKKTSPGLQPAPRSTFQDGNAPASAPRGSEAPPKAAFGSAEPPQPAPDGQAGGKKKFAKTMVMTPGAAPPPAPPSKRPSDRPPPMTATQPQPVVAVTGAQPAGAPAQASNDGKKSGTRKSPYAQTLLLNQEPTPPLADDADEPLREPSERPPPAPFRASQEQLSVPAKDPGAGPSLPAPTIPAHSKPPPAPTGRTLRPGAPAPASAQQTPDQELPTVDLPVSEMPSVIQEAQRESAARRQAATAAPSASEPPAAPQPDAAVPPADAAAEPEPVPPPGPAPRLAASEAASPVGPRSRGESFDPSDLSLQLRDADVKALAATGPVLRHDASGPPGRIDVPTNRTPLYVGGAVALLLLGIILFFALGRRGAPEPAAVAEPEAPAATPEPTKDTPAEPTGAAEPAEPAEPPAEDTAAAKAPAADEAKPRSSDAPASKARPKKSKARKKKARAKKARREAPAAAPTPRPREEDESIRNARSALNDLEPVVNIKPQGGDGVMKVKPSGGAEEPPPVDAPEPPAPPPPPPPEPPAP